MSTGYFIDNDYLEKYLELVCKDEVDISKGCERHHILPRSYFRELKQDIDNSPENLVLLKYQDHCLAHWYLFKCTQGFLKHYMACAYMRMSKVSHKLRNLTEEEYQQLQVWWEKVFKSTQIEATELLTYLQTHTHKEAARHFQVDVNTITHRKQALGLDRNTPIGLYRPKINSINLEEFAQYAANHTYKEIGKYFNIDANQIRALKKRAGLAFQFQQDTSSINEDQFKAYLLTHSFKEAAQYFNISEMTVSNLKSRYGIPKRSRAQLETIDPKEYAAFARFHTNEEIQTRFGIGVGSLHKLNRLYGVQKRAARTNMSTINKRELQDYLQNHTYKQASEHFHASGSALWNLINKEK